MSKLSQRKLKAIIAALMLVEAGSPADLTGTDDEASRQLYRDCGEALDWAREQLSRRADD